MGLLMSCRPEFAGTSTNDKAALCSVNQSIRRQQSFGVGEILRRRFAGAFVLPGGTRFVAIETGTPRSVSRR